MGCNMKIYLVQFWNTKEQKPPRVSYILTSLIAAQFALKDGWNRTENAGSDTAMISECDIITTISVVNRPVELALFTIEQLQEELKRRECKREDGVID